MPSSIGYQFERTRAGMVGAALQQFSDVFQRCWMSRNACR